MKPSSKLLIDIVPLYYRLKIHPFLNENEKKKFAFDGSVSIVFQTKSPTNTIIFNAKNLNIPKDDITISHTSTSQVESLIMEKRRTKRDVETKTEVSNSSALPPDSDNAINSSDNNTEKNTDATPTKFINNETESTNTITSITLEDDSDNRQDSVPKSTSESKPETTSTTTESAVLKVAENNNVKISTYKFNEKQEIYTITTKKLLNKATNYTLFIKFNGEITGSPEGIFRTHYKAGNESM